MRCKSSAFGASITPAVPSVESIFRLENQPLKALFHCHCSFMNVMLWLLLFLVQWVTSFIMYACTVECNTCETEYVKHLSILYNAVQYLNTSLKQPWSWVNTSLTQCQTEHFKPQKGRIYYKTVVLDCFRLYKWT